MLEGEPVHVEPPGGVYKKRLFHEHFADVLTSRLRFTRSDVPPTLFVDLARNLFIAVHFDDLIVAGSSSQLNEVVSEIKQCFTLSRSLPGAAQTYVCARLFGPNGASGEHAEHGMKSATPVVTPALARNEDEDEHEATTEKTESLGECWAGVSVCFHAGQASRSLRNGWRGHWQNI